jgi:hypothetical protein
VNFFESRAFGFKVHPFHFSPGSNRKFGGKIAVVTGTFFFGAFLMKLRIDLPVAM